jgi:hypothetical protein
MLVSAVAGQDVDAAALALGRLRERLATRRLDELR